MHNQNPTGTSQSASSTGSDLPEDRRVNDEPYPEKDDRRILPFSFLGYKILVGRNALSNERLITEHKAEHKKCLWLHVHNAKGAHVVICLNGQPELATDHVVFRRAMDLAIWYSVDRRANKKVNWSELQDVFKPIEGTTGVWKTYKKNNVVEL